MFSAIGYLHFIVSLNKALNLSKLSNIVIPEGVRLDKLKGSSFSFNALQRIHLSTINCLCVAAFSVPPLWVRLECAK